MGSLNLMADDTQGMFADLVVDDAYLLHITARVMKEGETAIWNNASSKLTIPGRAVSVKLVGTNIRVVAQFTPFNQPDNSILLFAQGQVWIHSSETGVVRYISTIKSIPIKLGESAYFFPLGVENTASDDNPTIRLEVQVLPYTRSLQKDKVAE